MEACQINRNKKAGVNVQDGGQVNFVGNIITRNKDGINVLSTQSGGTGAVLADNNLGGNRQDNLYVDPECSVDLLLGNTGLGAGE